MQTVHRAFPSVRIVTAAIDSALEEVRFPLHKGSTTGEAAGEGDFTARLVEEEEVIDLEQGDREKLAFGRRGDTKVRDKVAWVIKPGMGQIG